MKILTLVTAFILGAISGFSLAAWALYEPLHVGPAKYTLTTSPSPGPPYTMDGSKKLMRIECISESDKDCPQATSISEPGTLWLVVVGIAGLLGRKLS